MRLLRASSFLLCALALAGVRVPAAPSIAFSFDDGLDPETRPRAAEWNAAILAALEAAHVRAILYPAGRVVHSRAGMGLVRAWGEAGHAIGNHSWSHWNLNSRKITLATYIDDVARNQALLEDLPGWTTRYRFPYLKEGDTRDKRDGFRAWLRDHGYRSGAVSIDTSDWYYNERYLTWRRANPDAEDPGFETAYLAHLWDRARYYDSLANMVLGRSARHVILLHTNAINAAFLRDVIAMFRDKGWRIVSPEDAYDDPLYRMAPDVLPAGESILWAMAKEKGLEGLRYPAEDGVYEESKLDAVLGGK